MRYPGFCDILTVLTPIWAHEKSLEWEFDNLHNGIGFNPLGLLGPSKVDLGQTWSKLLKIFEKLGFDVKLWKLLFCEDFDLV